MEENTSDGMCRCCATEGSFKDFQTTYHWMGVEEIYSDMLKDCFNISLTSSEAINNGGICEVCVTQLRNAFNFKRQVQLTEEQFKKKVRESVFKSGTIKLEMSQDDVESDNVASDNLSDADYEVPIKEEKLEDKPKKRQAKASSSKAKKPKTEGETSKRSSRKTQSQSKEKPTRYMKRIINLAPKPDPSFKLVMKKRAEAGKLQDDSKQIIVNSNATPIRCRGGIGYACCFCSEQFKDPADLKKHTILIHEEDKFSFMKGTTLDDFVIKLDITGLKCNLCGDNMQELRSFMEHLKNEHKMELNMDLNNYVLPFKFEGKGLSCVICRHDFNNFKVLMEHMRGHYRNHVCEVCGSGFINKTTLRRHRYRHQTGTFTCSVCSKVFNTKIKKQEHQRAVHVHRNKRNKCGYCGEKFTDYTKKNDHEVKVHGAQPVVLSCQACDKVFDNQRALSVHSKTYHLMARRNI